MNQTSGLKRDTIDKFYTKCEVAKQCGKFIREHINFCDNDIIIEPSAGNGAWIDTIKELCVNHKFYDLYPENEEVIKQDYLELDYNNFKDYNNVYLIGNPPFGRQSSMALKFIKYSCLYCDGFCFIVPQSFKKDSFKNKIPLNFHMEYEIDLPKNSFINNEKEFDVPCVFQIWIKKNINREKIVKLEPNNFKFVKKDENPDISFRRVGVYAGKIDKNSSEKSNQSHYYIKFDNFDEDLYEKLKKLNFDNISSNTVGPKSISKQELIKVYNQYT